MDQAGNQTPTEESYEVVGAGYCKNRTCIGSKSIEVYCGGQTAEGFELPVEVGLVGEAVAECEGGPTVVRGHPANESDEARTPCERFRTDADSFEEATRELTRGDYYERGTTAARGSVRQIESG